MSLLRDLSESEWTTEVERFDGRIATALQQRSTSPHDVARGLVELAKLTDIKNPDYSVAGVAAAYAWRYLGLRATSIVAACHLAPPIPGVSRILDVGGGSGAGLLAMAAYLPAAPLDFLLVEPSEEMRNFAGDLPPTPHVRLRSSGIQVDQLSTIRESEFDVVLLSTCFGYGDQTDLRRLAAALIERTKCGSVLIAIEPKGEKARRLLELQAALAHGDAFRVSEWTCDQYPSQFVQARRLGRVTKFFRRIADAIESSGALAGRVDLVRPTKYEQNWSYVATTWHEDMNDTVLIAQRR